MPIVPPSPPKIVRSVQQIEGFLASEEYVCSLSRTPTPTPPSTPNTPIGLVQVLTKYSRNEQNPYLPSVLENGEIKVSYMIGRSLHKKIKKAPDIRHPAGSYFRVKAAQQVKFGQPIHEVKDKFEAFKRSILLEKDLLEICQKSPKKFKKKVIRKKVIRECLETLGLPEKSIKKLVSLLVGFHISSLSKRINKFLKAIPLTYLQDFFNASPTTEYSENPLLQGLHYIRMEIFCLQKLGRLQMAGVYRGKSQKPKLAVMMGLEENDLHSYVHDIHEETYTFPVRVELLLKCLEAYQVWLNAGIIAHRDIKLENFLLQQNGNILLTDGNFAVLEEMCEPADPQKSSFRKIPYQDVGTEGYKAPEMQWGESTTAVDIYSLGVLFAELMAASAYSQYFPESYVGKEDISHLCRIPLLFKQDLPEYENLNKAIFQLISKMTDSSPENRPTVADIRNILKSVLDDSEKLKTTIASLPHASTSFKGFPILSMPVKPAVHFSSTLSPFNRSIASLTGSNSPGWAVEFTDNMEENDHDRLSLLNTFFY